MVKNRKVFPCFFGSALKLDGVEDFLTALACFTREPVYPKEFGAKVFKISRRAGRAAHVAQGHRRRAAREGTSHLSRAESGLQ